MVWNRLQAARGGMCRGCVSSDFTLASCLSQFYSEMEHMLCSALYMASLRFLSPNQSCYESTLASLLKCFKTLTCRTKNVLNTTKPLLQNKQRIFSIQGLVFQEKNIVLVMAGGFLIIDKRLSFCFPSTFS